MNGTEQSAQPELTIHSADAQEVLVQFDPVGEEVTYGFDSAGVTDKASLSAVYQANGSTEQDPFFSGNKPTANGAITFTVGAITLKFSGLAVAAITGIVVNAILPGKDYTFSNVDLRCREPN